MGNKKYYADLQSMFCITIKNSHNLIVINKRMPKNTFPNNVNEIRRNKISEI